MANRFFGKPSTTILCLSVVFLLQVPVFSQSQFLTQQKQTVVFIFGTVTKPGPNGQPVSVESALGTGFLVSYPDKRLGPDGAFVYLVTAMHVLKDPDGRFLPQVKVRINLKKPLTDGREYDFIENVPVTDKDGKLVWFRGEDGEDVAVLPFLPDQQKCEFMVVPIEMFAKEESLKQDNVQEGDSLYFIGLMGAYYGDNRNYPVIRRGTLAMMTPERIQTTTGPQKVSIAELSSWPGNSGSPVFLSIGGVRNGSLMLGQKFHLFGVLLGGFLNNTPVSVVGQPNVQARLGDSTEIGISYILPADRIFTVLNSAEAKKTRDSEAESKASK
jgi:hypothetical protein